jgi:hypothetical protein
VSRVVGALILEGHAECLARSVEEAVLASNARLLSVTMSLFMRIFPGDHQVRAGQRTISAGKSLYMQNWSDVFKSIFVSHEQLLLGWLLGILSPAIIEEIRRRRRLDRLQRAMALELHELQFMMAMKTFVLRQRKNRLDDEFLGWLDGVIRRYRGSQPHEAFLALVPALLKLPIPQRGQHDPKRGFSLSEANAPLLSIHTAEIALLPVESQATLLNISQQLSFFNQQVGGLRVMFDRTFDDLSNTSRENVRQNLEEGYQSLADRAFSIAEIVHSAPSSLQRQGE